MIRPRALAHGIAVCLALLPLSLEAQVTDSVQIDLSREQPDGKPSGFSFGRTGQGGSGEWKVENGKNIVVDVER